MNKLEIYRVSDKKVWTATAPTRSQAIATFMAHCVEQVNNNHLGIHIMYLDQQELTRVLIHHTDDAIVIDKPYRTNSNSVKGLY